MCIGGLFFTAFPRKQSYAHFPKNPLQKPGHNVLMHTQGDFLSLFKDPLFVAIPSMIHTRDLKTVLARNVRGIRDGAYFTVNGFANFEEGSMTGRTKKNVTSFNANFLDIDLTPESRRTEAALILKELKDTGLPPTAVVLTGKGLHVYWVYGDPKPFSDRALSEYEALQSAIVAKFAARGADRQARDAARVLRVPGCLYFGKDGAADDEVELMHLDFDSKYEPARIAEYFRQFIKIDTKAGEDLMRLSGDDFDFASVLNVRKGSRHRDAYRAALSLIQRTKDLTSARKMFQAVLTTWEAPHDWRDWWSQFDSAIKTVLNENPNAFIGEPEQAAVKIKAASDIEMVPVEWLWDGFIAKGKPHMLTGEPGLGKSQITMDIAARLSTGTPFPSYVVGSLPHDPVGVLILSAEDDPADTMVPRLVAAKANLRNVGFLSSSIIEMGKDRKPKMRALALREDAEQILKAIASFPVKVGLVVIDPISAFLSGSQDSNSNSDARGTLAQLQATVMDAGIALLMINHTNKNTAAKSAHMRSMGSVGWNAAARATFYVFRDNGMEGRRVFSIGKTNLAKESGKGFFYTVVEEQIKMGDREVGVPRVEWDTSSFPTMSADEYSGQSDQKQRMKTDDCMEELEMYMAANPTVKSADGLKYMKERGFGQAEIYRCARKMGIIGEYGIWKRP